MDLSQFTTISEAQRKAIEARTAYLRRELKGRVPELPEEVRGVWAIPEGGCAAFDNAADACYSLAASAQFDGDDATASYYFAWADMFQQATHACILVNDPFGDA